MSFKSIRLFFSYFLLILLLSKSASSQEAPPVLDWQNTLGGSSYDAASKIIQSKDGGYIVVGYTYSSDCDVTGYHGSGDAWVVKLDASGHKKWQHALGGSSVDGAIAVTELPNGKIFVACNTNSSDGDVTYNHGATDVWIIALTANGNLFWQKTYGGSDDDYSKALIQTSDGHLVLAGNSQSIDGNLTSNNGSDDFWLLKIDTFGNIIWQKNYGGSESDMCNGIVETSDGGFVIVGSSGSADGDLTINHGNNDYWVVRVDNNGNLIWQKSLGGSSNESALGVIQNTEGNIVIAGYTNSDNGDVTDNRGGSDYWMVFLDSTGSLLKQITYGGSNSDVAYSIVQTDDGGYLLGGSTFSSDFDIHNIHGGEDFWLVKSDSSGNIKWSRTYGGSYTDRNKSTFQTLDGGCIMAGYTYSDNEQVAGNHGGSDIWIAKLSCKTPVSSYTIADDTVCINSIITLSNTSLNGASYLWLANGVPFSTNEDATFQFNSTANYELSLVAATCYSSDTSSKIFTVIDHPDPQVTSSKSYLCDGENITLSTSGAGAYLWSNGETTASIVVNSGGNYFVTITSHQCSGTSLPFDLDQYPLPQFSLGNDTTFCLGNVFSIVAPSGYQSYIWQNGSTNNIFSANAGGQYYVTISNGHCASTDTINLSTKNDCIFPIAEFATSTRIICENTCINFNNLSANATSWIWEFQGASPSVSADKNPTGICYNASGTYSVSLTVSNINGSVTQTQYNYIIVSGYPAVPTITLNGFILESSPAAFYQWFTDGLAINGATNQSYSAMRSGFYYVRVGNQADCHAFSDSVYFDITGTNSFNDQSSIEVFPNPAHDQFTISGLQNDNWNFIELLDVTGKAVYRMDINAGNAAMKYNIPTVNLNAGIYLLHVESATKNTFIKLVVTH